MSIYRVETALPDRKDGLAVAETAMFACAECLKLCTAKGVKYCKCKALVCTACLAAKVHACLPMRITRITDFNREKEHSSWLVDGLLPDMGWTLLHAPAGEGKTTFALQMCDALESGTDFLGRRVTQTHVLYIQADSPPDEWREITKRVARYSHGWTMVSVPSQCLGNPSYVAALQSLQSKVKPGFVVFDSLYNIAGNKINTDSILIDVNLIKALMQGVPWLIIHHQPHNESRAAGHNSLHANCSNNWCLLKTKLRIDKARLVKDKEVLLSRDSDGLWVPRQVDTLQTHALHTLTQYEI